MTITKIRTLIVDDEEPARKLLAKFISDFEEFEVICECADGFTAIKNINEQKPDLVFLDIQMPKLTGMEILELLENPPMIVFVTAYDEFAVRAFELNAIDYLLKPYSKQRFQETLAKIKEKISANANPKVSYQNLRQSVEENRFLDRIAVKTGTKIEILPIDTILFFQAQDDYIQIFTEKAKYLKDFTMKYLEEHLDNNVFIRIHRSYIVNSNSIERIEKAEKDNYFVIMKNNYTAKASKLGFAILKEKLGL